jgi:peptidoglycan glycosyltransferase
MLLFAALLINVSANYMLVWDSYEDSPYNRRVLDARFSAPRGPILVGNAEIASTKKVKDSYGYLRYYPEGDEEYPTAKIYAPVTGYYSYLYGASGLELTQSAQLTGEDSSQFLDWIVRKLSGKQEEGSIVETTLNDKAQKAAWKALDGRKGAVVAIDTKTGAIRALVSSPSYDPNELDTHDFDASQKAWAKLNSDVDKPMNNRATREVYQPGSTFKLITAAAALENGIVKDGDSEVESGSYTLPTSSVVFSGNCGGDKITLTQALVTSCNPAFGRLGVEVGAEKLVEQAAKFGFGTEPLSEISSVASKFPAKADPPQTAMSAIGEFEVAATPLQMAMVAAAIQNGGEVMKPYLVQRISTQDLRDTYVAKPQSMGQALTPANAQTLRDAMVAVVEEGTGTAARIKGYEVGGKTGTATVSESRHPYAWFVSFVSEENLAVCAFLEDAGVGTTETTGGRLAAPIAKAVMQAMIKENP